jgi:2-polyprenyl-6-methoxyphenol hydroxylase-like FAD-dependent oxidoreductase
MGYQHPPADPPSSPPPAQPGRCAPGLVPTCQPAIAVVGGSLTGPVVALLLVQAGFDRVTVYEAVPAAAPQGGGLISLEHSALDVLDRLGIPQHEYVKFDTETIWQITIRDRRPAGTLRRVYPGRLTTWTLLHQALTVRLPAGLVHTGRRVTGLAEVAGRPVLRFADGRNEPADLVVFADGRSSTGRRLLDGGRRLRYAGYVAHRGDTPTPPADPADFLRFEPGPGVQFNIAPVPGGCDWTFYLNATAAEYTTWFGGPPARRVFALPRHVSPAARQQVDQAAEQHLPAEQTALVHATTTRMAVPVLDIAPPTAMVWPVGGGHAVLLGDALAPVRPHTARGANNGIEQAAGLAAALTQHRKHRADLAGALTGWQRRHLPAAAAAVRLGPVIGGRLGLGTR